jgi:hypothetical protein
MTTARWTFAGAARDTPLIEVFLVTGGHPDRWLPWLARWRATPTPTRPAPPSGSRRKAGAPRPDHRWLEPILAQLLAPLTPVRLNATVEDDGQVRGCILDPRHPPHPDPDYTYLVSPYPASFAITNTRTQETTTLDRDAAWAYLFAQAEGDPEATAALDAEAMLAGLVEDNR